MSNPQTNVTVGLNTSDGMGHIVSIKVGVDMGDHGRAQTPMHLNFWGDTLAKFSWANKKNGRIVYREIEEEEIERCETCDHIL